ncbi:MAG: type III-B CRISPR-associated protein Cas10/Cmr2 [Chitinophagales bacterium]
MTNTKKYIGITIGPIIRTISMARSTKELWAASYLFSYIMRSLIEEIGVGDHERFITPYIGAQEAADIQSGAFNVHYGAGVFPDRMVVDVTGTQYEKFGEVEAMIERVKEKIIQEIVAHFILIVTKKLLTEKRIKLYLEGFSGYEDFLKRHFQIYAVQVEMDIEQDSAVAAKVFPLLEAIENQTSIISHEKTVRFDEGKKTLPNFLEYYLSNIHIGADKKADEKNPKHQTLYQKVFEEGKGAYAHLQIDPSSTWDESKEGFPSIRDIATIGLREQSKKEYEAALTAATEAEKKEEKEAKKKNKGRKTSTSDHLYSALQKTFNQGKTAKEKQLKQHHKYICIVHADGDSVGAAIRKIGGDLAKYRLFSSALSDFSKRAAAIINDFSGKPIYVGGDDLLFFAPIRAERGNIFELVEVLDECFDGFIRDFMQQNQMTFDVTPTLSFGVSMTYHKFPLFEAEKLAREVLLKKLAKGFEGRKGKKNALAFRVSKHSTSYFEAVLYKDKTKERQDEDKPKTSYEFFMQMVTQKQIEIDQLSSLSYKLRDNKALLYEIADKPERVDSFFTNFFNEAVHKASGGQSYIGWVKGLLKVLFAENLPVKPAYVNELQYEKEWTDLVDSCIKTLYGILRMIHFLNQNASNEDE